MNLSFFYVFFLILTINLTYIAQAAKFIRNAQTLTCLDVTTTSSLSCSSVALTSCPTDRFANFSDSLKWNLIPLNASSALANSSEIMIGSDGSNNNQLCLSTVLNNVEACPCNNGDGQKWILNDDRILSASNTKNCLSLIGDKVGIENCQASSLMSWKAYHVSPNAVNLYVKTQFSGQQKQLFIEDYDSKAIPNEIFSSPFSVEIPPGFEFIINRGGNNGVESFDSDMSQMLPIDSSSSISIKLKDGMVIYEHAAYFSASEFFENGFPSASIPKINIGSVLVSKGFRGVIWSNSNFTGNNLGFFEPIANFTGVSVEFASSLDVSATTCKEECGSGGHCSNEGTCKCEPNFTGDKCEKCSPGFFGQNCQSTVPKNSVCDEETGCKCNLGFTGANCDQCAPGFVVNGTECKEGCVNGVFQGNVCNCIAGFAVDTNGQCTICNNNGYYKSGDNCKACPPGCNSCGGDGKCIQCSVGIISPDGDGKCVPDNSNNNLTPCDITCSTCSGTGSGSCLTCNQQFVYLEGSCVPPNSSGGCTNSNNQKFFVNNAQKICEPCPSGCLDCNIQSLNNTIDPICTGCVPGFFLKDDGTCVKECPEGTYDNNSVCKKCDSSCATCNGPDNNQCTKCSNKDFSAFNGTCSSNACLPGFFALDTLCTKCHRDCAECSGPGIDKCTKCPQNRPILTANGQCIEVCPMGYYADDNKKCQKCDSDCSSCVGPRADQCLGCSDQNKVLLEGTCNGSCPVGSELNKVERLCQNLNNEEIIPPSDVNKVDKKEQVKSIKLEWWHILLIATGSLLLVILVALLIRYCAVKRRKQKTKEFGDHIDDNTVAQNLKDMLRRSRGFSQQEQQEMSHKPSQTDQTDLDVTPPAYDTKEGELYWNQKRKQRHQKHLSMTSEDYNKWKTNSKDWKGFDVVTEESLPSSSKVGYNGHNQEENSSSGSKNIHRNSSKGSLRSNRPISTKRTYSIPVQKGESWDYA